MMQGLIKEYEKLERMELAAWATIEKIEPKNTIDSRAWRRDVTVNWAKRGIISGIIDDLKAAAVSIDAALDTSAAKLRRVEAGRLTWQARAERLQESLNDANAQIEDMQDALDYDAPSLSAIFADDEKTAVYSQNPPATADAPQRDESDDAAGEDFTSCPECGFGKTAVFEELDWVLFCKECGHIFRKTDGSAPPRRAGDKEDLRGIVPAKTKARITMVEYIYHDYVLEVESVKPDGFGGLSYRLSLIGTPFVESHGCTYTIINGRDLEVVDE